MYFYYGQSMAKKTLGNAVNVMLPKNCSDNSFLLARRDIHGWYQSQAMDQIDGVENFLRSKYPHPKQKATNKFEFVFPAVVFAIAIIWKIWPTICTISVRM